MTTELLTVKDVAQMLHIKENTLRHRISEGKAPKSAKIMGKRVFRKQDVIDWIDSQFK